VFHAGKIRKRKVGASAVLILVFATAVAVVSYAEAQERAVRVAAAADLKFAMGELTAEFEKQSGTKIDVTYGSSGNFFSQIENGAPFDLFFSANMDYARKLEAAGLAEPGTLYPYALGRIVIWMPTDVKVDVAKLGWNALRDSSVQKVAIANPEHAPYGRAAVAAMQKAGIYEQLKGKLVYGENISQTAQFVQSGSAQAGIVALSLAVSPAMKNGRSWLIPSEMHPAIEQGAVLLKNSENKEPARVFLEFVESAKGRETLTRFGFEAPRS
jgi:molybdate transport system substrate-binding protein